MSTARYVMALLLVVPLPPALLYWLIIHPFARFWRRLGPWLTYLPVIAVCIALGVVLYRSRDWVLGADLGTNWILIAVGAVFYLFAVRVTIVARRHLRTSILVGLPEVSKERYPGKLLQEGIYSHVRHPRYLSVVVGTVGWALVVNFTGVYATVLVSVLALYVLILLEDRELLERFGEEYAAYRERVPALIPRIGRKTPET